MSDKPVTLENLCIVKTLTTTEMIEKFDPDNQVILAIGNLKKALGYQSDDEGRKFIESKFAELDKFLDDHWTAPGKIPEPDFVVGLLDQWIDIQYDLIKKATSRGK